jgi:15-hydroxyprostaglandin dehydrogenase (NAD)
LAKNFLANNWRVALLDVSRPGPSIAAELGPSAIFFHCDVSSWESPAAVFAGTFEKWGLIDFTALNVGIEDKDDFFGPTGDVDGNPVKPGLKTLDVNLIGVFYGIRLFMHYFRKNPGRGGMIVTTSSDAGLHPLVGMPQYTAWKHGICHIFCG